MCAVDGSVTTFRVIASLTLMSSPVPTSLAAEAGCDADLLVVGSRRLGGLAGIVAGSTSHALLTESDRPTLVAGRPG